MYWSPPTKQQLFKKLVLANFLLFTFSTFFFIKIHKIYYANISFYIFFFKFILFTVLFSYEETLPFLKQWRRIFLRYHLTSPICRWKLYVYQVDIPSRIYKVNWPYPFSCRKIPTNHFNVIEYSGGVWYICDVRNIAAGKARIWRKWRERKWKRECTQENRKIQLFYFEQPICEHNGNATHGAQKQNRSFFYCVGI